MNEDSRLGTATEVEEPPVALEALELPGTHTPSLVLREDERVLASLDLKALDIGFILRLLGYRERLIATNRRVIHFRKKIWDFDLKQILLRDVGFVGFLYRYSLLQVLFGCLAVFAAIALARIACRDLYPVSFSEWLAALIVCALFAVGGVLLILLSRKRLLVVSGASGAIAFQTRRVSSESLAQFLAVAMIRS